MENDQLGASRNFTAEQSRCLVEVYRLLLSISPANEIKTADRDEFGDQALPAAVNVPATEDVHNDIVHLEHIEDK